MDIEILFETIFKIIQTKYQNIKFFFHIWFFSCNHRVSSIFCIVILHKTSRHLIIPPYYIFHYTMGQNLLWSRIRICQTYLWVCYMMSQETFLFTFSLGQSKSVWKIIVKLCLFKNQIRLQNYFGPIMHCISDCQPLKQLILLS